jgi:K+-transporting ATPase ATPase A chain
MSTGEILQITLYFVLLAALTPVIGKYIAAIFMQEKKFPGPVFRKIENGIYKLCGIDSTEEMAWKKYASALLCFNFFGWLIVFLLQVAQQWLPMNPAHLTNVSWHLAFNTAVSFMTNTNWQSYSGETTLTALVQMLGLTVQNFVSAATGIAVMVALARGFSRKMSGSIGNFWSDLVRSTMYILLPFSILYTVLLMNEGVVQTFVQSVEVTALEGGKQTLPLGPAASQIAIKQLGTNGGGYFNANSAYPHENPTPVSNFLEMLALLLLPSAFVYAYGGMIGSIRHARVLWGVMFFFTIVFLGLSLWSEYSVNPVVGTGASMEGKEVRFGVANSILWSVTTTDASNGSVNAMHDSLTPLSGMLALLNMQLGEIIFGGVGAGMYGMVMFVILTVFLAGLMVGRTPEYLGKKIESYEVKLAAITVLAPNAVILIFSAIAAVTAMGLSSLNNAGPHGLTEILYAFSSAAGNNGSAFAGLNANTVFYNCALGVTMLVGRFFIIVPVLAIAGSCAQKKTVPVSSGTFMTDTLLFGVLLVGVIIIVAALTHFPSLALGPIVEHFLMQNGVVF